MQRFISVNVDHIGYWNWVLTPFTRLVLIKVKCRVFQSEILFFPNSSFKIKLLLVRLALHQVTLRNQSQRFIVVLFALGHWRIRIKVVGNVITRKARPHLAFFRYCQSGRSDRAFYFKIAGGKCDRRTFGRILIEQVVKRSPSVIILAEI